MEYESPGRYSINVPISPPETFSVVLGMYNEHGQYFEDVVSVGAMFTLVEEYVIKYTYIVVNV
jgi:hypothetical protein